LVIGLYELLGNPTT